MRSISLTDHLPVCSLSQVEEIDILVGKDREALFTQGMILGKKKCSVIRDSLYVDGDCTMDIRTKSHGGEPTYNISVGRAGKGKCFEYLQMTLPFTYGKEKCSLTNESEQPQRGFVQLCKTEAQLLICSFLD